MKARTQRLIDEYASLTLEADSHRKFLDSLYPRIKELRAAILATYKREPDPKILSVSLNSHTSVVLGPLLAAHNGQTFNRQLYLAKADA